MKKLLFSSILLMSITCVFAQSKYDTLEIRKYFDRRFHQNGKELSTTEMTEIVKSNPEAYKEMQTAIGNKTGALVFKIIGGVGILVPFFIAPEGGKINMAYVIAGAGVFLISVPFSSAYVNHAKKAADIYNEGLRHTTYKNIDLNFGFTENGISIKLRL